MSDSERVDSSSESDDLSTTGLIATRAKRSTAGNLYATLRANLDDEDLQKELLAEDDEEDAGEYQGSDKDGADDDEGLESSSDEDDGGPPKEGDPEDLSGEQVLKSQERAELKRKRKAKDARLKLPTWRKKYEKRVKLADDVKTEDGSTSERPRKKSDRTNWLPGAGWDGPVRQSRRALAVANRETIHAHLMENAERSEKQRRVMKHAAARDHRTRRMDDLTQEERLKKCELIEHETANELEIWEQIEEQRQREREEMLAAKRKRGIDGPCFRSWSGSVLWVGDKINIRRLMHGSQNVEEIKLAKFNEVAKKSTGTLALANLHFILPSMVAHTLFDPDATPEPPLSEAEEQGKTSPAVNIEHASNPPALAIKSDDMASSISSQSLQTRRPDMPLKVPYLPSSPSLHKIPNTLPPPPPPVSSAPIFQPPLSVPQQIQAGWPPGTLSFSVQPQAPPSIPPSPPVPLVREQAQRTLLILDKFPQLDTFSVPSTRRGKTAKDTSAFETDPIKSLILPNSFPALTTEETKYLLAKHKKKANERHLIAPAKPRCALTSWPARFRHPQTGLPYADMHQYKAIQRILAGGCQWSSLLGCWVGPTYGAMGRPARGVPDSFSGMQRPSPPAAAVPAKETVAGEEAQEEKEASKTEIMAEANKAEN